MCAMHKVKASQPVFSTAMTLPAGVRNLYVQTTLPDGTVSVSMAAGFRGSQCCGRRDEKRRSAQNPHFRCYTQRKLVDARLSDIAG